MKYLPEILQFIWLAWLTHLQADATCDPDGQHGCYTDTDYDRVWDIRRPQVLSGEGGLV